MGNATTYRKRCLKYGGRVITFIRNRVYPQVIRRGMADEHFFPGRLQNKVMIPFPCFICLHPLSTPGTCCLIWEMCVLTSGLSIKHNLHL
ncbi:hypothetical protein CDAR_196171 [Caerostris darwini]|uniref:Uncharacterized protein n=1 Tax=Caerostris darwini TaxID=1538125 RepID=A0AAV4MG71_9ARAC|nr:hypothetical protein CDAR_196171 [Caerostris darwini]